MNNPQHPEQANQRHWSKPCVESSDCSFPKTAGQGTLQGGQNTSLTLYSMSQTNPLRQKEQPLKSWEGGRTKRVNKADSDWALSFTQSQPTATVSESRYRKGTETPSLHYKHSLQTQKKYFWDNNLISTAKGTHSSLSQHWTWTEKKQDHF